MENNFNTIVAHYDEIGLKGKNQQFFVGKLIENIKNIGSNLKVKRGEGKIVTEGTFEKEIIERLRLIPGIANFAPAIACKTDLEKIKQSALQIVNHYKPKTFKIETTRSYKPFELNSLELSREVGAYVLENYKDKLKVDVHNPELLVKVELAKEKTYILGKKEQGVGGLPVGATGKVVCLVSGGIDSPVAAFEVMKRGAKVIFVHFHNQTINKKGVENKIKNIVRHLTQVQGESRLYIIPFADLQKQVITNIPADLRMIVYRRLMFQIAEQIAKKENAKALITGDSLAQVASQTLENMEVIYKATDMLKLAPLIGMNKTEIISEAAKIGTYDISIEPYEDCCSLMIAKHPETRANLEQVEKVEESLNVNDLVDNAIATTEVLVIR
ncbi:tRNA 4-thiouridine(8) synthase ThiI [Candidatus Kuenenbacteria bacterium]|nr:tRNA 4-thiouridine(8) synthase ThiI [Candidatus Kuenenbacteria bacterium]